VEKIEHVTDTALIVAAYRALETTRPDAIIQDPFAAALAGERGTALARRNSDAEWMSFGVGLRAHFVDELLTEAVWNFGAQTVLNAGAGLDTRPWRLDLPNRLRWIEVDFEAMLRYKAERLRGKRPHCLVEQVAADISLASDRERIFRIVGDSPALIVTEGLLMYLPRAAITALFSDLGRRSGVLWWILDVASEELIERLHGATTNEVERLRAKDHLIGQEIIDLAASLGWELGGCRLYRRDAFQVAKSRILRLVNSAEPQPEPLAQNDPSGVYLFRRKFSGV
jgi:methyltransferase (TIGR00027 family)